MFYRKKKVIGRGPCCVCGGGQLATLGCVINSNTHRYR